MHDYGQAPLHEQVVQHVVQPCSPVADHQHEMTDMTERERAI